MIDNSKIDRSHTQSGETCLLSSYAVAGNYFTGQAIREYFYSYYIEFKGDFDFQYDEMDFYKEQGKHINNTCSKNQKSGYCCLLDLYLQSSQLTFAKDRDTFFAESIAFNPNGLICQGRFKDNMISTLLKDKKAILGAFINNKCPRLQGHPFSKLTFHSILIYATSNGFYFHDTNLPLFDQKLPDDFYNYPEIGDMILYIKH